MTTPATPVTVGVPFPLDPADSSTLEAEESLDESSAPVVNLHDVQAADAEVPDDRAIDAGSQLAAIAGQLKLGGVPPPVTVRTFLSWFGARRRGFYKVKMMQDALRDAGLRTTPDFASAFIDGHLVFSLLTAHGVAAFESVSPTAIPIAETPGRPAPSVNDANASDLIGGAAADPTYRIGKLTAANTPPVYVRPGASLQEAVTLLISNDFSQLPVMQSERSVKGVVSWTSIGTRLAFSRDFERTVDDFLEKAIEISADTSLFSAIETIVQKDYVLVRDGKGRISGIVTTSDLSIQFGQLGEPFLVLGEIENHIRRLIDKKFTIDEVRGARDPADAGREVKCVADLAFGEYVRLLSKPERWSKLGLSVDRGVFIRQLEQVREIRNDVMHFDPDGVDDLDLMTLRRFGKFLAKLQEIGAT